VPPLRLAACLLAVLAVGCGGDGSHANPLDPNVYLDHALSLMRSRAVYTPAGGWTEVTARARKMAAWAKTPADTYPAIEYVIGRLQDEGDHFHAVFLDPEASKGELKLQSSPGQTPPPTVSLAAPRIGLVMLPSILSSPASADGRRYTRGALLAVSALRRRADICGRIVDVRGDQGGDMFPMLLAVGPILGSGRVVGFTAKGKRPVWGSKGQNRLSGAGRTARAPIEIADFEPAPAVAVLSSPTTVSSGEDVAVAFRGRARTRSFGGPTGGATNSPGTYRLADGATIRFASYWDTDRTGRIYRKPIAPDVAVTPDWSDRPVRSAASWLRSTRGCR
jgi:carboxyl-terminal processing protease